MFDRRVIAAMIFAAALPLTAHAQTTVLFNSFIPPTHPINTRVLKGWVADLEKATEGRVKFEVPQASLAAPQQQLDGVQKGVFDMGYMFHGLMENKVKLSPVAHLPGVNSNSKGSSIALWRTYEKYFKAADEYNGVHLLGLFVFYPGTLFGIKTPVNSVADIKGTKIYGLPGVPANVLEAAGGGVVAAPAVRSFEIISGGTVDAFAGYAPADAFAFKTLQYAKHITDLPGGLTAPSFALFINKKKWASLSPADRDAITTLSGESLAERFSAMDAVDNKVRADATAQGVSIKPASEAFAAEVNKLAEPLVQAWLKNAASAGVDGAAALAFYRQQAEQAAK